MRHSILVEGRPNCVRQSLASTLSAPRVAATSCCDPGRHANLVTPCLLTPCLNVPNISAPSQDQGGGWFSYGLGVERLAVPVFGSGASSGEGAELCVSAQFNREGRIWFQFRFLKNASGRSGSAFGSCKNGSDSSGCRCRFSSRATLQDLLR